MSRMKFFIIFVFSVISVVNCELPSVESGVQILLDLISGGIKNLFNDDPVIVLRDEVTFFFTNRNNSDYIQIYEDDANLVQILISKPIVFIVHGWYSSKDKPYVKQLGKAWLDAVDCNVILVDYKRLAAYLYNIAALKYVPQVGGYLCSFIKILEAGGILGSTITIVGHSLGAQVAGYAGTCLGDLGTIYALDAAGPLYTSPITVDISKRLDKTDADWVSAIHTTETLGTFLEIGDSDYFMDSGIGPQCGCPTAPDVYNPIEPMCSHSISIVYMIYSLNKDIKCKGIQGCSTITNLFMSKACVYDLLTDLYHFDPYKPFWFQNCVYDIFGIYSQRKPGKFLVPTKLAVPHCFG